MNEIHLPKTKVAELHAICAERNNDPVFWAHDCFGA